MLFVTCQGYDVDPTLFKPSGVKLFVRLKHQLPGLKLFVRLKHQMHQYSSVCESISGRMCDNQMGSRKNTNVVVGLTFQEDQSIVAESKSAFHCPSDQSHVNNWTISFDLLRWTHHCVESCVHLSLATRFETPQIFARSILLAGFRFRSVEGWNVCSASELSQCSFVLWVES